jgi:Protein of unknown function (DUF3108)
VALPSHKGRIPVRQKAQVAEEKRVLSTRFSPSRVFSAAAALAALAWAAGIGAAHAEARLEAHYTATLAGIPIGKGTWQIDIADDQYSAIASGRTSGLLAVFSSGHGSASSRGAVRPSGLVPASFSSSVFSDKKADEVRMGLAGGAVKDLIAEPPLPPAPDRIPVTEAHRRGVIDPMTGALIAAGGNGDAVGPEACHRILPIFDGRGRFDLVLSFKRIEQVRSEKGYAGPVVVCGVAYRPIAGHRPNRPAIRYMVAARDIEVAFAPVAGTRILAPYRISVPTVLGPGVLEAHQFVAVARPGRTGAAPASARTQ